MGQYSMVDPTRAPAGKEVAWAYTHVPPWPAATHLGDDDIVRSMELEIERRAHGFRDLIRSRYVTVLEPGAVNLGTAQLQQQLIFRPIPRHLGRPETPVRGLYLASAAAHPGGGVHGGPGSNAARAALGHDRLTRRLRR
jgi:phytoene dehydrogenase-like protein